VTKNSVESDANKCHVKHVTDTLRFYMVTPIKRDQNPLESHDAFISKALNHNKNLDLNPDPYLYIECARSLEFSRSFILL
jgi:hypothetical protein